MKDNNNQQNNMKKSDQDISSTGSMEILGILPCASKPSTDSKMTLDTARFEAWLESDVPSAAQWERQFLMWGEIIGVRPDPTAKAENGQSFEFEVIMFATPGEDPKVGKYTFAVNPTGDKGSLYDLLLHWNPEVFPGKCACIRHLVGQRVLVGLTYREDETPLVQFYRPDALKMLIFDEVMVDKWYKQPRSENN